MKGGRFDAYFLHELSESFWNESVINYKDEDLEIAFLSIKHIGVMPHVLIDILIKLFDELNFSSIRIIEKVNRDVFTNSKLGMVFDLFMRIICGNIENYDKYKRKEIYDQMDITNGEHKKLQTRCSFLLQKNMDKNEASAHHRNVVGMALF